MSLHTDQVTVTASQVRAILADQAPEHAGEAVTPLDLPGTVHAIFRVGDEVTARFPLQETVPAPDLERQLRADAERMHAFASASPVPGPQPLRIGRPGHGYPLPWTLQSWLPGSTASPTAHGDEFSLADDLTALLAALRSVDVSGSAFTGPGRGGVLADHDTWAQECLERSEPLLDTAPLRRAWERVRELPPPDALALCHTDLIPPNLLVADGRLVGVLDTGDTRPADPALDLVSAWHLFDEPARERLRTALACGDAEWERGRGWALEQALGLVWYYQDTHPVMAALGRATLARIARSEP